MKFGIGQAITRARRPPAYGQGRFVDDLGEPGDLHLVFVRSPHAARALAPWSHRGQGGGGCGRVFTGADLVADRVGSFA